MKKMMVLNWKMNGSKALINEYAQNFPNFSDNLIVCPPYTLLDECKKYFITGAQDCSGYDNGAYTGQVSANLLKEVDVKYVIIGHSECRNYLKQGDQSFIDKMNNIITAGLIPIYCIGESYEQYKNSETKEIISKQLDILKCINFNDLVVAYEPLWSIGTSITPKISEIEEIINYIRNYLKIIKSTVENNLKILYGGSVNENNIKELLNASADGFLIGGASLVVSKFIHIFEQI